MLLIAILALAAAGQTTVSGVAHVVDGDTLIVRGERIRLSGVDAPELAQRCGPTGRQVACGQLAASWLRARVEGRRIVCVASERDRYTRLVAVCRWNGDDIGAAIVSAGWATAYRRYSMAYVGAEKPAKAARLGMWATGFEDPATYRRGHRVSAGATPPPNPRCVIKGNLSARGERIYHLPGSCAYPEVQISVARGERWFCSTSEANTAGWRPVR
nr:thermonuclease family protein [uncultured Sphingomonas sp.]